MDNRIIVQNASTQERVVIQEYSLADFTFKVSSLVQQGYIPSEENEGYPMQLGMLYTCNMLKVKPAVEPSDQQEALQEVLQEAQEVQLEAKTRGRAKKV